MSPCVAEGHSEDRGHVILSLDRSPGYAQGCPIGVAAWVDFPDIDLIDELRALEARRVDHRAPAALWRLAADFDVKPCHCLVGQDFDGHTAKLRRGRVLACGTAKIGPLTG